MKAIIGLLPAGVLFVIAFWLVWRGFRIRPDSTNNQARGGGVDPRQGGPGAF